MYSSIIDLPTYFTDNLVEIALTKAPREKGERERSSGF